MTSRTSCGTHLEKTETKYSRVGTTGAAITLPLAPMSKIQCLKILHICANSLLKQMLITRFVGASTTARSVKSFTSSLSEGSEASRW